jgi:hypothetical protein
VALMGALSHRVLFAATSWIHTEARGHSRLQAARAISSAAQLGEWYSWLTEPIPPRDKRSHGEQIVTAMIEACAALTLLRLHLKLPEAPRRPTFAREIVDWERILMILTYEFEKVASAGEISVTRCGDRVILYWIDSFIQMAEGKLVLRLIHEQFTILARGRFDAAGWDFPRWRVKGENTPIQEK